MNELTEKYDTYRDGEEKGTEEEAQQPVDDGPRPYPKDLPVKLAELREWARKSFEFSISAFVRRGTDDRMYYDLAGHLVVASGKYDLIWVDEIATAQLVRPKPTKEIRHSSFELAIQDVAQTILGLEDAEAELLFFGEDTAGTEQEDLMLAFLDHLIERCNSPFGGFHMDVDDVEEFKRKWSLENGIPVYSRGPQDEEGTLSPYAFPVAG